MWPDVYFFAGYFNNRYWPINTPGGGGLPLASEQIAKTRGRYLAPINLT